MWLLERLSKPSDDRMLPDPAYTEAIRERSSNAQPGRFAEAWKAFDDLFSQEYWKRVWIIQEIVASKDVLVRCGQKSISWSDMEKAFWGKKSELNMFNEWADADSTTQDTHPRDTHQLFDFWAWKKSIASVEPQPLLKALIDSRRSKAKNPRDHVSSVEQVFMDLTVAMIRANGNLTITCLQGQTGMKRYNTPSWVPDWSALAEVERPWLFKSVLENNVKFKDGLATGFGALDESYKLRVEGNILSVSGRFFGTVDGLTTGISNTGETVGEMIQPTVETTAYTNGHGHAAALYDTLILAESSDASQKDGPTDLIHYLTHPKGKEVSSAKGHTLLATWLAANSTFKICGVELSVWTSKHFGHHYQWKNRLLHHLENKTSSTQDMHTYMTAIETVLHGGLRLMTTSLGHVGMVLSG
ncbi:hypothetical protein M7I_7615 [Glarea lozoyensis 74030]|uniref:Heterokaryon incompatibility domain-containing protein n=1 Tax=Glarea lozoyensis (strain ATCC 74030 / MF5533) TaxID=1104152 RepID=H0EXS6_GLAL7|nr:hypothetical protein M7I_7615 [Glarea lozoyensis 74030]